MKSTDYVESLRADSADLAAAAAGRLEAAVPSCPGWSVKDLVVHTGEVHRFWYEIAARRLQSREDAHPEQDPGTQEPLMWFKEGAANLAHVLEEADPSIEVWTWSQQKNIAFIQRRMAQETAVHRWDAQAAARAPEAIGPEVAMDGIDELFDIWLPAESTSLEGSGETIHFHQTDGDGEWLVRVGPSGIEVESGHAKGDAAVRGTASDLLLVLWRRLSISEVETFGDTSLVGRFLGWMDLD